jgi:hypothetical protein
MGASATDYSYGDKANREAKLARKREKRLTKRAEKAAERQSRQGTGSDSLALASLTIKRQIPEST